MKYFNPRTSCEVRHDKRQALEIANIISIHAPRVRCDHDVDRPYIDYNNFNPRTSCEVRQQVQLPRRPQGNFNPRTSCEVRRSAKVISVIFLSYFNPRTSCEVRQQKYRSFLFIFAIYDIIKNFNRIIFILFHLIISTI